MERAKRKAINFDLDTKKMKELSVYPDGYTQLKRSFKTLGFEHRQGSGYVSLQKIDSDQVNEVMIEIVTKNPWLADCVKKIDVTDIGRQHDMTAIVTEYSAISEELPLSEEEPEEEEDIVPILTI